MDYRERYLSEETLVRAEREYLNRVPVTPKESAAWFGRLLTCFWIPFVEPMLLKTAIVPLQVLAALQPLAANISNRDLTSSVSSTAGVVAQPVRCYLKCTVGFNWCGCHSMCEFACRSKWRQQHHKVGR
jgi:hypothetical protein